MRYRVAGYVKLAKLWERSRDTAIPYHHQYYEKKFEGHPDFELVDVYIDITGRKEIKNRTIRSFLYYVPYVTLAVMTFPAIMDATAQPMAGLASFGGGLFPTAIACSVTVFVLEMIL